MFKVAIAEMYPRIQRELVADPLAFREHISGPLVWSIAGLILTGEKPKYPERNLSQCYIVHHTSYMD
jgi:hypothetical protein